MSKIIFLNGPGSSGKTSIARAIQYLSDDSWLTFGVDTFIAMTPQPKPDREEAGYFSFVPGQNSRGPLMRVESRPKGEKLFGAMPEFARLMADRENNLIIDEVILDDLQLHAYARALSNHTVYFVGVFCDLEIMQEREILRGDRVIGLSNDQIDRVHNTSRNYDLKVDTSRSSIFSVAKNILDFLQRTPEPTGFVSLHKTAC